MKDKQAQSDRIVKILMTLKELTREQRLEEYRLMLDGLPPSKAFVNKFLELYGDKQKNKLF
jgi:hypothetical protein